MTPTPDTPNIEAFVPLEAPAETPPERPPRPARPRRLTKKQMGSLAENLMREHSKEVLGDWWSMIKHKLRLGDPKTMEMVGRMYQYDRGPGGVTIYNQHLQVNGGQADAPARVRSFDQIIGKLEEAENIARQNRLLNAAGPIENLENSDEDAEEIEDGETEDSDAEDADTEDSDADAPVASD